ncbi:MAG: hypothetical protein JOY99_15145 [Sphingomonadaceae bacterium]|nr:hypothetical protein [Sphingomonadaceae bacterium]
MEQAGSFSVSWDQDDGILIARMTGFWTFDTVQAFRALLFRRIAERPSQPFGMLTDLSDHPVQSQAVHEAVTKLAQELRERGMERGAAVLSPSTLSRMQVGRSAEQAGAAAQFFSTEAEALAYLRS